MDVPPTVTEVSDGPLDVKVVWCNDQVMGAQLVDRMLTDDEVDQLVARRLAA